MDSLRGVLERTRGDVTNSLRQQKLQAALAELEARIGLQAGDMEQLMLNNDDDRGGRLIEKLLKIHMM